MIKNSHVVYVSHGAGPMPLLGGPDHMEMIDTLNYIVKKVGKPEAVIVISAHWEAEVPTITSGLTPPLIYDYYGFPKESYDVKYPCLGNPELAEQIHRVFAQAGIDCLLDESRGYDHGMFVPLKIMYPEADIPCLQLSLQSALDPQAHINLGRALQTLNRENVLVIGSGFSFHNMRAFSDNNADGKNEEFQSWLAETVSDYQINESRRAQLLTNWDQAPFARYCHPREEHLLPLHVCYGLAEKASNECYQTTILNKKCVMFHWQIN